VASANRAEEFYIGYLPKAPRRQAFFMAGVVFVLFLLAAGVAAVLVRGQNPFAPGVFEYLMPRALQGIVVASPYPALLVLRPGLPGEAAPLSRYHLVAEGKHGAQQALAGWEGKAVRLRGTLIHRDNQTLLEVVPGSITALSTADPVLTARADSLPAYSLGTFTLAGEIVDSKCYFGVMKPGELKTHRACAVRCISGGIPPVFVVRDQDGNAVYLFLVSAQGRSVNAEILDMIAEPLVISGEIIQQGDFLMLRADPKTYRRS